MHVTYISSIEDRFWVSKNGNFIWVIFLECIKWLASQQQATESLFTSVDTALNALKASKKITYNVSRYRIWKIINYRPTICN